MNKHRIKNNSVNKILLKIKKTILIFLFDRSYKRSIINLYFQNGKLNTLSFQIITYFREFKIFQKKYTNAADEFQFEFYSYQSKVIYSGSIGTL